MHKDSYNIEVSRHCTDIGSEDMHNQPQPVLTHQDQDSLDAMLDAEIIDIHSTRCLVEQGEQLLANELEHLLLLAFEHTLLAPPSLLNLHTFG